MNTGQRSEERLLSWGKDVVHGLHRTKVRPAKIERSEKGQRSTQRS